MNALTRLLVQERPGGIIGPFCPGHAYLLDFTYGWVRHVILRDVEIYGEFVRDCKYCLHPERYDPPSEAGRS